MSPASATRPVLVFGHHHPWDPASDDRSETYFGVNPDDSEALCAVIARREAIAGYFAGHTHRTRTRHFAAARNVPIVEIACVKDYPGAWAEYRVYEGGYVQLTRRIDAPAALGLDREDARHVRRSVSRLRARRGRRSLLRSSRSERGMPALADLRVIDMATVFAGPGAARHLGDFGADVIKIESPAGDGVRRMGWFPPGGGDSYTWKLLGRNKRAVVHRPQDGRGARRVSRAGRRGRRRDRELPSRDARAARYRARRVVRAQSATRDPAGHRVRSGRSVRVAPGFRDDGRGDERVRRDQR